MMNEVIRQSQLSNLNLPKNLVFIEKSSSINVLLRLFSLMSVLILLPFVKLVQVNIVNINKHIKQMVYFAFNSVDCLRNINRIVNMFKQIILSNSHMVLKFFLFGYSFFISFYRIRMHNLVNICLCIITKPL